MFKDLTKLVYDKTFKLTLFFNKININNYEEILIFEDNLVLIKSFDRIIKIKGSGLSMKKLENNELLIEGAIRTIDLGD